MNYFLDSSGLVKRYILENGSAWVEDITRSEFRHTILITQVTKVEVMSAVMRRVREKHITPRTSKAISLLLQRHYARQYIVIKLSEEVLNNAERLLALYPLRAYDSIQLASAIVANERLMTTGLAASYFVSGDIRLLEIANQAGLAVIDPNSPIS